MANIRTVFAMLLVLLAVNKSEPIEAEHQGTIPKPEQLINTGEPQENETNQETQRTKRQYYNSWTSNAIIRVPPVNSYSLWQPQYYQIRRPYFIPVWGTAGRAPLYFPPQPIHLNPGYPVANPPKRYPGLPYLPPDNKQTDKPDTNESTTETDNKYGEGFPVWDQVSSTTIKPTRRTKRPGQNSATHPPLVHKDVTPIPNTGEKSAFQPLGTTRRPSGANIRPQTPAPTQSPAETPGAPNQPSRCVWAIISCCSATSEHVSYSCFEQLGCTGAFWDRSPCESEFARSAISTAMNYYNTK